MALDPNINRIKFLRSSTAGSKPTTAQIAPGEIAINLADKTLYSTDGTNIIDIGFGLGGSVNGPVNATNRISTDDFMYSKYGFSVNSETADGRGISLYGNGYVSSNGLPSYGIAMAATSKYGSFGAVTGSHATYFTINSGTNRGWIFNYNGNTNVASISGAGIATFSRVDAPLNGNATSATKLLNGKNINGVLFDGTSDINTPAVTNVLSFDHRAIKPNGITNRALGVYFTTQAGLNGAAGTDYGDFISLSTYQDSSGGNANGLFFNKFTHQILHYQGTFGSNTWGTPKVIAYTDSSIAGNAGSATKLFTPRKINNAPFDGTQDISVNATYSEYVPDNADLNNYKTPGLYYCPTDSGAATQLNVPAKIAYSLFIERHAGIKQTLTQYASNRTFIRRFYNGSWDNWRELAFLNPDDQTFTENIILSKDAGNVAATIRTKDASYSELMLSNANKATSLSIIPDGTLFLWDVSRQTPYMSFSPDGVQSILNSKLLINTPTSLNVTGGETFAVTGGESSPIRFKINRAGAITTNVPETGAAIVHATSYNWYNTEWQIGNIRGGSTNSLGFGITKFNDTLVWRHDGNTMTNYGNISNTGSISTQGDISSNGNLSTAGSISGDSLITRTGRIGAPTSTYHYLDIGRDSTDITTVGQYGGAFRVVDTSNGATSFYVDPVDAKFSGKITTKPVTFYWNVTDLGNSTAAITVPDAIAPQGKTGYAPFIHGSVQTDGFGYRTNVSIGAFRGSNTWSASGAYIAIGGNDNYTTEDFRFMSGGYIGTSSGTLNILGTLVAPTLNSTTFNVDAINSTTVNVASNIYFSTAFGINGIYNGNGDGATLATANLDIRAHYGLGILDNLGNRNIVFNSRTGEIGTRGVQIYLGNTTSAETRLLTNDSHLQFLTSGGNAKGIATGGVLTSDSYADFNKVPTNGIYSKGDIICGSGYMVAHRYVGITGAPNTGVFDGNANTATRLQTARTIGGVSFDGTASINLPGVNIQGNQNTTGNAGSATVLQTARNFSISGAVTSNTVPFNGNADVNLQINTLDGSKVSGTVAYANIAQRARTVDIAGNQGTKLVAQWTGAVFGTFARNLVYNTDTTLMVEIGGQDCTNDMTNNFRVGSTIHMIKGLSSNSWQGDVINATVLSITSNRSTNSLIMTLDVPGHGLSSGQAASYYFLGATYTARGCYFLGTVSSEAKGSITGGDYSYLIRTTTAVTNPSITGSVSGDVSLYHNLVGYGFLNGSYSCSMSTTMVNGNTCNFVVTDNNSNAKARTGMVTIQIWDAM
ncbi:putative tail fiber protein [Acinetobacter phage vB_AbaM_PhT2]|uniref:Putative tail fiber protein n=1 Tax=Acinetobacter phage vB_AbaM_PhT2 TaxID=2690230 RepID=A0A6B9SWK8_9CAUD|nr:tail fiber protein [Acinetobacter phage vB_AbaM_PhT2]QHJ75702.1 putative tail fiber protein [Acinetobacter phage vB_AbaM_PhT2]